MSRRHRERGSAVLYTIVLSPIIVLSLALVVEAGSLQLVKERLRSAADTAMVDAAARAANATATGQIDSLVATQAARQALYDNLQPLAGQIAGSSAAAVATNANIVVITNVPSADPFNPGATITAPTIESRITVPVRTGLLAAAGLPPMVTMTISSSAALRVAGNR